MVVYQMKKIVLLCVFLFSTLCGETPKKVSVQLSWLNQFQFAGYYIAKEKGYYKDAGIDVEIKEFSEQSMKIHSDFVIRKSSALIDKMNGEDIIILGTSYQHSPMVLMVLENSGINTPKDLFGKKVMITSDAKDSASILAVLNSFQLDASNINFIPHSFNVQDLIDGKTDAMACYISNEPLQLDKLGIKYKILEPKDYGFDFYDDLLVVDKVFLEKNPQLTKDFYEATIQGWEYAYSHIEESARIIYEKYNTQHKTLYELIQEGESLKTIAFPEDGQFGTLNSAQLAEMGSVFKVLGLVKNDFNAQDFIYEYNAAPSITFNFDSHVKIIISIVLFSILMIIGLVVYYTKMLRREIDNKELAQNEASLQNDFLQKILDSMGNIVVVTNPKTHTLVIANNELFRFFGMKNVAEFKSKYESICDAFVEKEGYLQKENDGVYWTEYLQINHNQVHKVLLPHDGKEYLYFVYSKILDSEKTTEISVFTNITDLKAMDDRIANDVKIEALNEMITNISHHWRQPLSLISTIASTILINAEMDIHDKEQIIKSSTKIIKTVKDVSSMLDIFSDKAVNNLNINEKILVSDLVRLLESHFKAEIDEFHILLNFSISTIAKHKVVSKILFDVQKEIIQNSIDILKDISNGDDKTIFVTITFEGRELLFDIYDNGGGVSQKNIGKIFEPYFTTYHQSKGKGLGLYFVRNTIHNLMKGEVFVQNKLFNHNNKDFVGLETIIKVNIF